MRSENARRTVGLLALAAGLIAAAVVLSSGSIVELRLVFALCGVLLLTGMMAWVGDRRREGE